MNNPRLIITDGTESVNLLAINGWLLKSWSPSVPEPKGGGVFHDSPLVDGRKLAYRKMENVFDTFNLVGNDKSQNLMIASIQKLQQLLEKGVSYWATNWQNEPVWIEAKAANETEIRYAVIVDYRLNGFGGPFEQPFFSTGCNTATEAMLTIEHIIWQETKPGEAGECVKLSNLYYAPDVATISSDTFEPNGSAYDGSFSRGEIAADLTGHVEVGYTSGALTPRDGGILFDNVTVPKEAYIIKAIITLECLVDAPSMYMKIEGEIPAVGSATTYTNNTDYYSRTRSLAFALYDMLNTNESSPYSIEIDVTEIVQNIVGFPEDMNNIYQQATDWSSGDIMGFFLSLFSGGDESYNEFTSFDDGGNYASLYIEYSTTGGFVQSEATCNHEVMISNKSNRAAITHAFWFDADAAPPNDYSDNLITEDPPYDLLPSTPAVGDTLFLGSCTDYDNGGVFHNAIFDLLTAQTGITEGTWYYYDGGWQEFEIDTSKHESICGDEIIFKTLGVGSIVFNSYSADWDDTDVNGVTGKWIKFVVTAITGVPTPPVQQNRIIYTAITPYVDISSDDVPGDLPALARIVVDGASCESSSNQPNTLVMGLRSLSRGSDFNAYLNCSDVQQPSGITFDYNPDCSIQVSAYTPTGKYLKLQGIDTGNGDHWEEACKWTFTGDLAKQYIGVYHAYLRIHIPGGAGYTKYRLRCQFGIDSNVYYSDVNAVSQSLVYSLVDLGQFSVQPTVTIRPDDNIEVLVISLDTIAVDLDTRYTLVEAYDIILIPADEWSGNFGMDTNVYGFNGNYYGKSFEVDGVTNPKQYRSVTTNISPATPHPYTTFDDAYRSIYANLSRISSGEPILQKNSDQRLWFLQYYQYTLSKRSYFENCGKVCIQRSGRYLLMRGNE